MGNVREGKKRVVLERREGKELMVLDKKGREGLGGNEKGEKRRTRSFRVRGIEEYREEKNDMGKEGREVERMSWRRKKKEWVRSGKKEGKEKDESYGKGKK